MVAMSEWWSGSTVTIYFENDDAEKDFGRDHSLVLMNHRYEVDWLMAWMISDKLEILGVREDSYLMFASFQSMSDYHICISSEDFSLLLRRG